VTRIVRVSILIWGLVFAGPSAAEERPAADRAAADELPSYELMGMPITHAQMQVVGAALVREQPAAAVLTLGGMPASPHQVAVLTRGAKRIAVEAAHIVTPAVSTR
jgi:hypothetical protein